MVILLNGRRDRSLRRQKRPKQSLRKTERRKDKNGETVKPHEKICKSCSKKFSSRVRKRDYCSPSCYYSPDEEIESYSEVIFKTVGGYEVLTDGDESVKLHRLQACLNNDPRNVFDSRYMNTHHLNTIPWDNREENLLLLRARFHKNLHRQMSWEQIVTYYANNDVSDAELQSEEKHYKKKTKSYLNKYR